MESRIPVTSGVARSTSSESLVSGVSWASVFAGAVVAAALTLILVALGAGLGFTMVSPWTNEGASAKAVSIAAIIWLIATQLIASAMGGYLSGRLRTKWVDIHTDEVFFRDTAHGFLSWGVAVVISAALLASAATSLIGDVAKAGGTAVAAAGVTAAGVAHKAKSEDINSYFTDALLRKKDPSADENSAAMHAEIGRILIASLKEGDVSASDKDYLAKIVAARNGVSAEEAATRVNDVIAQAKKAADDAKKAAEEARKVAAQVSLWTFLALLIGAFCASYAATMGGRQRDHITI